MRLLFILAGLLAVCVGKETVSSAAEKQQTSASAASTNHDDDIIMLEIDVKEPAKRSPISASTVYGAAANQYIIRNGDDAQELSPEYLGILQQYAQAQSQAAYAAPSTPAPTRRPQPPYARQQQRLQQAYHDFRKPAVVPPRPRVQLHPQALAQAEAAAEVQAQIDARNRAEAARLSTSPSDAPLYQVAYAPEHKLGTFEQELLQLVSANQAQEFKLQAAAPQPKRLLTQSEYPTQYAQQLVAYPAQYAKPAPPAELPEQYHIETTAPRYQQPQAPVATAYQSIEEPGRNYQNIPAQQYPAKPAKSFRPSPQYQYVEDPVAAARAQAHAEAQALAFRKIAQASHNKHQQDALEQIRIVEERYRQQTALEQIQQGVQVSEAGRAHIEEETTPKDPEAAYRARLKAQAAAEAAEARRAQEAAEYKAHADAILKLQAQQQAHLKAQEEAHQNALNFERNQLRAQAHAQAIANAQAAALYKVHSQQRAKANSQVAAAARAQEEQRKLDPEHTPVIQYLLPSSTPLPPPNSYFTSDQVSKYQARSAPKPSAPTSAASEEHERTYPQPTAVNQPRSPHKVKIPPTSNPSLYVSQSGLLKKAPVKSLTVEDIIEQDQLNSPQIVRIPAPKGPQRILTQEDLAILINAGYTVTPVPEPAKSTQPNYSLENSPTGYYVKKGKNPVTRPEYVTYEEVVQRPLRPVRKNRPILKQNGAESEGSEKVTFLVPLEPVFGTRQTPAKSDNE